MACSCVGPSTLQPMPRLICVLQVARLREQLTRSRGCEAAALEDCRRAKLALAAMTLARDAAVRALVTDAARPPRPSRNPPPRQSAPSFMPHQRGT